MNTTKKTKFGDPILPIQYITPSQVANSQIKETIEITKSFISQMKHIVNSLPISSDDKRSLIVQIEFHGIDFIKYAEFQSINTEDEDPWAVALLPLAVQVVDSLETKTRLKNSDVVGVSF